MIGVLRLGTWCDGRMGLPGSVLEGYPREPIPHLHAPQPLAQAPAVKEGTTAVSVAASRKPEGRGTPEATVHARELLSARRL